MTVQRLIVTNQIVTSLIVASLMLALGFAAIPAHAQSGGVQARIPFPFTAASKSFPAGQYTLIPSSDKIKIEDAKGTPLAIMLANHSSGGSASANGQVIFHCYRYRCFLVELRSPALVEGRQVLTSAAEAKLANEERAKYFEVLGEVATK